MHILCGKCHHSMCIHSPRHLAEWAELIDAEIPDEYTGCETYDGISYDY